MSKTGRKWLKRDWTDPDCVRAEDIPYDGSLSIKDKIDSIPGAGSALSAINNFINGNFDVWQRGTSFGGLGSGVNFTADRWYVYQEGTNPSLDVAQSYKENQKAMTITIGVVPTDAASVQYLGTKIEDEDIIKYRGSGATFTLSFYVNVSRTGTYTAALMTPRQGATNSTYLAPFTVNAANTWEKKSISFEFNPSGDRDDSNAMGLGIFFCLSCGTAYESFVSGSWLDGIYFGLSGQTELQASDTFEITGAALVEGNSTAVPLSRSYGQELRLCQRYYYRNEVGGAEPDNYCFGEGHADTANWIPANIPFPSEMRIAPTVSYSAVGDFRLEGENNAWVCTNIAMSGGSHNRHNGVVVFVIGSSSLTAGRSYMVQKQSSRPNAWLAFDAEI